MYKKKRSKKKKITASHRSPYRSPYRTRSPRLERCIRSVKSRQKASCASHKWKDGLKQILWGLAKKIIIADTL